MFCHRACSVSHNHHGINTDSLTHDYHLRTKQPVRPGILKETTERASVAFLDVPNATLLKTHHIGQWLGSRQPFPIPNLPINNNKKQAEQ